ncbi:MAG: hypothetical protein Q9195_002483 [Heterodermia aff. obscurata]
MTDMTISLDHSKEAGSLISYAKVSQGKRRKIEGPDQQDVSAARGLANGISKEEKKSAKAKRAADRAKKSQDGLHLEESKYPLPIEEASPKSKKSKKRKHGQDDNSASKIFNGRIEMADRSSAPLQLDIPVPREDIPRDESFKDPEGPAIKLNDAEDKALAKAIRKAEKAERKRLTKAQELDGPRGMNHAVPPDPKHARTPKSHGTPMDDTANVIDRKNTLINTEASAGVGRKAKKEEKKRLKAIKKAQDNGIPTTHPATGSDAANGSLRPELNGISVPTPSYVEDPSLSSLSQSDIDSFLSANFISIVDPTSAKPVRPIIDFFHLPKEILAHSSFTSFKVPTPIQAAAWPFLLSNRDVIGVAETGSGKTLAFGVPCIRSILTSTSTHPKSKSRPSDSAQAKAVIVSPTRELAVQIHEQIEKLATPVHLATACIYGGVPKESQRDALKTAHIIVATPGRLNDLIEEGSAVLSQVNYLVLDEADRMLDKGFEDAIRTIISHTLPTASGRQTLMFTATWPPSVRALAATFMTKPVHITIGANNPTGELRANKNITQKVEVLDPEAKQARLLQLIKQHGTQNARILIFCLYKKEAVRIESYLHSKGLRVAGIHGDLPQAKRTQSLESFKSGACPLLVATDVAARGLDIPAVKLVLNVTFPLTVEDYVHRIGRTGRAGAPGLSITLFTVHDKAQAGALVNVLRGAGQEVPEELLRFGTTVKRKEHEAYGAWVREVGEGERRVGVKIRFD